jgi:hypothetical protein
VNSSQQWIYIASSSDGTKLVAAVSGEKIYTSTDSGFTWTQRQTDQNRAWKRVASSSDGVNLVALTDVDYIWTSADSGETWTQRTSAGSRGWHALASNSDGTKLVAGELGGSLYTSTDSGASWIQRTGANTPGNQNWFDIASSADGTKLVALGSLGGTHIWTSTDSGVTWTARATDAYRKWVSVTSSSDGTKLAAVTEAEAGDPVGGYIYTSTNSGVTWTRLTSVGKRYWFSIASSSDGLKLAAVHNGGYIYTTRPTVVLTVTGLVPGGSATITQETSRVNYFTGNGTVTGSAIPATTISTANVVITAPVTGATPVTSLASNGQYTTAISWNGSPATFASNETYTATVVVTPISGYTLFGVAANFFTINSGAPTSGNLAGAGSFTKTFPATATTISTRAIAGITVPITGGTPVTTTTAVQYNTTISWSAAHARFRSTTAYTATITLTPNAGYTLTGVTANFFTVSGATSVSHLAGSGTITAVFPATGGKLSQAITFNTPAGMTRTSANQSLTPSTTATGGYNITLSSNTPLICSVSPSAVTQLALGTCSVTASQAGDEIYAAASSVTRSFTIIKAAHVISMNTPAAMARSSDDQTLIASSSASLSPLSFSTTTPTICQIVSSGGSTKVKVLTWPGTCSVSASHAGNLIYAPATTSRSFVISKDPQTINFTQPVAMTRASGDETLTATSSASLSGIVFTNNTSGVCSISGAVIKKVSTLAPGTCSITASHPGNANFAAASTTRTFTITKKTQTINNFPQPTNMRLADADQDLTATASSGLTTTLTSKTSTICSVVNRKIRAIRPGYCYIAANQSGNTDTEAAPEVLKTILIRRS